MSQLNFNYNSSQNNFELVNINEFKNKLGIIGNYISNLKDNEKTSINDEESQGFVDKSQSHRDESAV